jgi:AcrR family transcriptional regulator
MMNDGKRALAELEPEGLAPVDESWQERKRSEFRIVVLEAVITCLAENGYAQTTTELVAAKARVSRGTMLHRFPTRQILIEAGIEYAFFKRMQNFIGAVNALTEEERVKRNLGIVLSWQQYFTTAYKAYLELHIAAKTDEDLRKVFIPRAKLYDQIWRREIYRAFPEWSKDKETLDRSSEFVRAALEGLALNSDIWDDQEHLDMLVQFVSDTALALRDKSLKFRKVAKVKAPKASRT